MAQVTLREYLQEIEDTLSAGHVEEAHSKCQRVLTRFPDALEVQRLLGEVYLAKGQLEEAQQALDWILTNDPENVIAYCDRALISEHLSDVDTALDCYQQAYELSRGNRDIRQQFNLLSTKAGQQGFMFSRAGLARLYMRGGLLPQAIQEWDAVLAVNPDRLDARTGLLEAYWREGLYDEAEQLAQQTLQDVPGCIKSLLILAHITSPKNMEQAREYVQQAEMLDPDLLMAQELFEDMLMSQARHPFLKLLKKVPAMIDTEQISTTISSPSQAVAEPIYAHVAASQQAASVSNPSTYERSGSDDLFDWNNSSAWRSALELPTTSDTQSSSDSLPTWSHDIFSNAWAPLAQPQEDSQSREQENTSAAEQRKDDLLASSAQQEEQSASSLNYLAELNTDDLGRNGREAQQAQEPLWMSEVQNSALSAPPAWLSMLTQEETRGQQSVDETVAERRESAVVEPTVGSQPQAETTPTHEPVDEVFDDSWRDALQASLNSTVDEADEEEFSFGPAWLKSLGATALEPDEQEQPVSTISDVSSETIPPSIEPSQTSAVEAEQQNETSTSVPDAPSFEATYSSSHSWLDALSAEPDYTQHSEESIVNTLEDLENSLRLEGFVPLEPNSLATIAQSQSTPSDVAAIPSVDGTQGIQEEEPSATRTPSSALEQLGNLAAPHVTSYQMSEPNASSTQPVDVPEETSWMDSYRIAPALPQQEEQSVQQEMSAPLAQQQEEQGVQQETATPFAQFSEPPVMQSTFAEQNTRLTQEQAASLITYNDDVMQHVQKVEPVEIHGIPVAPVGNASAFFENELETTMKRPAVRLQSMKQSVPPTPAYSTNKEQRNGAKSLGGSGRESLQRLQERLVQGYQHQLYGDYDEAMQEYRVIIKNAPELLDEVVSNVRALLKLAPQYSPGYRVLGDAYMRQGEYLQAMEAYNKALTMAKKARV